MQRIGGLLAGDHETAHAADCSARPRAATTESRWRRGTAPAPARPTDTPCPHRRRTARGPALSIRPMIGASASACGSCTGRHAPQVHAAASGPKRARSWLIAVRRAAASASSASAASRRRSAHDPARAPSRSSVGIASRPLIIVSAGGPSRSRSTAATPGDEAQRDDRRRPRRGRHHAIPLRHCLELSTLFVVRRVQLRQPARELVQRRRVLVELNLRRALDGVRLVVAAAVRRFAPRAMRRDTPRRNPSPQRESADCWR